LAPLVADRVGGTVSASWTLGRRVGLSLELPFVVHQARPSASPAVSVVPLQGLTTTLAGDLRVSGRYGLLRAARHHVDLAVDLAVTAPTGGAVDYAGEAGWTAAPGLAVSKAIDPRLGIAANVGATLREESVRFGRSIGSEAAYGIGVRWRAASAPAAVQLALGGFVPLSSSDASFEAPLECLAGGTYRLLSRLELFGGAGAGLLKGWGVPDWRVFAGIRAAPRPLTPDADGDGIDDDLDLCPDAAGPSDARGCPVPDRDRDGDSDGVADRWDACPAAAGPPENRGCPDTDIDADGIVDRLDGCAAAPGPTENKGCPDTDADGDGIIDRLDECRGRAGLAAFKGCPEPDADGDGIPDSSDACPKEAGPREAKGCAIRDTDGDGVPDHLDACPGEAGPANEKGCPAKAMVVETARGIETSETVRFLVASDIIGRESFPLLDRLAEFLRLKPVRIRIEGHTDQEGKADYNLDLSRRRAAAVLRALADRGVPSERMTSEGFGASRPLSSDRSEKARALNRRVAFVIVDDAPDGGAKP